VSSWRGCPKSQKKSMRHRTKLIEKKKPSRDNAVKRSRGIK
jgi:hypothetical protein